MVKIFVEYEGDLHCTARHAPSEAIITTDAPKDNQGKGETFSPTDLVAAALATCIGTIIGILGKRKGWDFKGMRIEVEKIMINEPFRRIGRLPVQVWMPINLSQEERKMIEKAAAACPVHHSLHPDIEVSIHFRWPKES